MFFILLNRAAHSLRNPCHMLQSVLQTLSIIIGYIIWIYGFIWAIWLVTGINNLGSGSRYVPVLEGYKSRSNVYQ